MIIEIIKTVCSVLFWFSASVILTRIAVGLIIQGISSIQEIMSKQEGKQDD